MISQYILIAIVAFFCESIDSSLGMGYGTILTPILLFMGYEPLEVVPLVLFSEFITGILSAFLHHKSGNVNLNRGSRAAKVASILAACSIIGTVLAAQLALQLPAIYVKGYIAILLLVIGTKAFISCHKKIKFSWFKILTLGIIASFNKGLSGGGYGPLVTGGQVMAGLKGKNAVGITSLAEGLTCLVGIISYLLLNVSHFDWYLGLALLVGALLSVPVSVNIVKLLKEDTMKRIIAVSIISMGVFTLYKTFNNLLNFTGITISVIIALLIIIYLVQFSKERSRLDSIQETQKKSWI